ncbi:MAG: hypothetical protein ABWY50_06940 [Aeromicrobium sp.]
MNLRRFVALWLVIKALLLVAYFLEAEPPSERMIALAYAGGVTAGGAVLVLAVLYLVEGQRRP